MKPSTAGATPKEMTSLRESKSAPSADWRFSFGPVSPCAPDGNACVAASHWCEWSGSEWSRERERERAEERERVCVHEHESSTES